MKNHNPYNGKIPDPKEIEKEIGEFLSKKFGGDVKIISPAAMPQNVSMEKDHAPSEKTGIHFDLKPEDLIAYLDQYVVRQDHSKAILATKICTHFNRIKHAEMFPDDANPLIGRIKNNILMVGPTGVGKTYMIKLIARKIGVPFVKGDATKFSETGYVGGDVEDLVRDLVREADDDIELAQYGIIYIDEIDKIASSHSLVGADVSRTGVQRALLKPMEETEVDLKVPHDPISMFQEIERFRKTGKRDKNTVNTKNILFIMSGAFGELSEIVNKRLTDQGIGFGARLKGTQTEADILKQMRSEDLIEYGFESEFVGRLPVLSILERLTEADLYDILKNPNNPVILGKKLDFGAYGIQVKFENAALKLLARQAFSENTGARGLVSAIERSLMPFERALPSSDIRIFPVTEAVIRDPHQALAAFLNDRDTSDLFATFERLAAEEKEFITAYVQENKKILAEKHHLALTPSRIEVVADLYSQRTMDMGSVIRKVKSYSDEIKKMELYFFKNHDINIVMEEDAIDYMIDRLLNSNADLDQFYKKLSLDFEHGLELVRERTGKNRFFINREALLDPESFVSNLLKNSAPTEP
ncbi:MAG: AAA family ATPase [Thermodesulfobacteriota bacterium]